MGSSSVFQLPNLQCTSHLYLKADLDQQSLHSDPEESYLRDLPEFPSVEEFPSIEHSLLHFPLRGPGQAEPGAQGGAQSEGEPLSPASLLIQHLASPLHFVNTHFNGHGRPPGAEEGSSAVAGAGAGAGEETAAPQGAQRSLEALSEEIVSTAISTVVQNTLSALLRSGEAGEDPSLAEFLPTETPPGALETSTRPTDAAARSAVTTIGAPGSDEELDEAVATESGGGEEMPDDTLVPTEEEDFELLDQSELEQADEELDLGSDGQAAGGTPDTASPHHQPQS